MRKRLAYLVVVSLALGLVAACGQAAPAPAQPTAAPAAAAAPTKAPAPAVDFPAKGKTITIIVPWNPGGDGDRVARARQPMMEKELGVPVQVVNKPGAAGQVGVTEGVQAPADGYTIIAQTVESMATVYHDPERKAVYNRKSFTPLGLDTWDPATITVQGSSPFKTVKDVVDAAKAAPKKVTAGTSGIQSLPHLNLVQLEEVAGIQFAITHFDGAAKEVPGLLGGHVQVGATLGTGYLPHHKSGEARILAIADSQANAMYPNVPTLRSQGYDVFMGGAAGLYVRSDTPPAIVDILARAMQKASATSEYQTMLANMNFTHRYINSADAGKYWDEVDRRFATLLPKARQ